MNEYLERVKKLIEDLEASIKKNAEDNKSARDMMAAATEKDLRADAKMNDAMAKLRIGEKYENFDRLNEEVKRKSIENKKEFANIATERDKLLKVKADAELQLKKLAEERNIISSKLSSLKSKEAKIDRIIKVLDDEKVKGEFVDNLKKELANN